MMDEQQKHIVAEFQQNRPRLLAYALKLTRIPDRANDLLHETLLRLIDKAHLYETGSRFGPWACTVMYSLHINHFRRPKNRPYEDYTKVEVPQAATQEDRLRLGELAAAIKGLSKEQRRAVLLVGLEGMTYAEAAARLGVPEGTIKSSVSRARSALRRAMA